MKLEHHQSGGCYTELMYPEWGQAGSKFFPMFAHTAEKYTTIRIIL